MQESENSPETAAPSAETREPTTGQIDEVAALLRGDEPEESGESENSEASSETNKSKGKPKNLDGLAETLGVEVADLYKIEIPFADGDNVEMKTLGELKDSVAEQSTFEVDRLAWEEQRTERENQVVKSMQEVAEIVNMLPKSAISEQLLEAVARKRANLVESEGRMTKQVIPEWSSEDVETADRQAMREHMSEYGFAENYLDSVVDHRTLRFIRESMLRQQRIERALAQVKTVRKPGHKPSGKPTGKPAPAKRGSTSRARSQVSQVAELLNTG